MTFNIILALAGFSLLIFVHELGHFLAAKLIGVKVEAFSLGFGPHIGKKWGETEYRLGLAPLGGYVKLSGGEQREAGKEYGPRDFMSKSPGQRAFVYVAGAAMNVLCAFVAFIVAFGMGVTVTPAVSGGVLPGSPAWHAGIRLGDEIVSINGRSGALDFEDLTMAALLANPEKGVKLGLARDGHSLGEITIRPKYEEKMGVQRIGIRPPMLMAVAGHQTLDGRDPVKEAGMEIGDVILRAGLKAGAGEKQEWAEMRTPDDFEVLVEAAGGKPLAVEFRRGQNETRQADFTPMRADPAAGRLLGVALSSNRMAAVRGDSWLGKAGAIDGDRLLEIGGAKVETMSQAEAAFSKAAGREVDVVLARAADKGGARALAVKVAVPPEPDFESVAFFEAENVVDSVIPGLPAERAGLAPGDRIVGFDRRLVKVREDLTEAVKMAGEKPSLVEWTRGGEKMTATVAPEPGWDSGIFWRQREYAPSLGPLMAVKLGTRKAGLWVARVYSTLQAFVTGRVASKHLGGPIAIARITYAAATMGVSKLLYYLGMISLNLGLLNLLPIPVMDGGHLVFAAVEKARRKPVSERVQTGASYVGLAVLLALALFTTFNDVWRWITGG